LIEENKGLDGKINEESSEKEFSKSIKSKSSDEKYNKSDISD